MATSLIQRGKSPFRAQQNSLTELTRSDVPVQEWSKMEIIIWILQYSAT